MISIEKMINAVNKTAKIIYLDGSYRIGLVESYEYEKYEDEEPFILFEPDLVAFQSELADIEIIDEGKAKENGKR